MNYRQSLNQIKILHGALFIGIVLFGGVSVAFHTVMNLGTQLDILPPDMIYLFLAGAAILLLFSDYIYRKKTGSIERNMELRHKITTYRIAALLRVFLIETAGMAVGIGYLLSGNWLYLIIFAVPLLYFIYTFPKDEHMQQVLDLTYTEQQQLGFI